MTGWLRLNRGTGSRRPNHGPERLGLDDELRSFRRAQRRHRGKLVVAALAIVVVLALLPVPLGLGPFAWRLFRYDRVTLHFANITGEPVRIEIDHASGTFPSGRVHSLDFRGGEAELRAYGPDGSSLESHHFYTDGQDVFFNLAGSSCFAVMDVTGWYRDDRSTAPIEVIGRIHETERIYLIPAGIFVPPRGVAPERVPEGGRVIWIDDVACELLDETEEHLLIGQQLVRMEGRRERRRQLQEP